MLYADDMLLMGHIFDEMSVQLRVTTDVGNEKSLQFDPSKSAIVIFNAIRLGDASEMVIQEQHTEVQDQC